MFTGIVQGIGIIVSINKKISVNNISIEMGKISNNLQNGASVSINGVCLTVANIIDSTVTFDAIQETLKRSTLGSLKRGDEVNLERALKFGDELGGHLLSGHIMSTAIVADYEKIGQSVDMKISINDKLSPFIIEKGYIAIDGISLTVGQVDEGGFSLHLIPETLRFTTIGGKGLGEHVNIEVDSMTQTIVSTVERILGERV